MGRRRRGAVASSGGGGKSGAVAGFGAGSGSCELGEVLGGSERLCRGAVLSRKRAAAFACACWNPRQGGGGPGAVRELQGKDTWGECSSCTSAQEEDRRNARERSDLMYRWRDKD